MSDEMFLQYQRGVMSELALLLLQVRLYMKVPGSLGEPVDFLRGVETRLQGLVMSHECIIKEWVARSEAIRLLQQLPTGDRYPSVGGSK